MENVLIALLGVAAGLFALRRWVPGFFLSRGYAHQDREDYQTAEQWFLRAARWEEGVRRLTGKQRGLAIVYTALGLLYHRQRRTAEAAQKLKSAIAIYSDLGRIDDLAPAYASLGKLYYDIHDMASAERTLNEALAVYSRRPVAGEAMQSVSRLLDLIAERRQNSDHPTAYTNEEYCFSFMIPPSWLKQRLAQQFSDTGGQVAISHRTHRATFNVSVGPPDRPEWLAKERRGVALEQFLSNAPGGIGDVEVTTSAPVGGEPNTVSAEHDTETEIRGVSRRRRAGMISVIHNELEYALQWSAEQDLVEEVKGIVDSFNFEK